MVKYRAASNAATSALKSIPFENIIGAPLEACIRAQQSAAQSTVDFINAVGLQEVPILDAEGNETDKTKVEAIYVSFQFIQGGRMVQMNVPLLSIVPIPYIAINTIDINFKANITAATTNTAEDTSSEDKSSKSDHSYSHKYNGWRVKNTSSSNISAQVSSKKDSKATQESKYSVEYTIDVAVHASQDSMPAGMAKVLEMIGTAMDLCSADGEIYVNGTQFEAAEGGNVTLEVSYKTPGGLIDNDSIQVIEINPQNNNSQVGEPKKYTNKTRDALYFTLEAGKTYSVKSTETPNNEEIVTVAVTQAVVPATGVQQPAGES